jgi:hypothetical protein
MPLITTISSLSDQAFGGFNSGFPPFNTVVPVITGTYQARRVLTVSTGSWVGSPIAITYTYNWYSNSTYVGQGSSFTIPSSAVGENLTCVVSAINTRGTSSITVGGSVVVANVPSTPTNVTVVVSNYNKITVSPQTYDSGGATTTYYATSTPAGISLSQVNNPVFVINPALYTNGITVAYSWVISATNSVGSSGASAASASVKSEPAIGALMSGIVGQAAFGKYIGNQKALSLLGGTGPWTTANATVNSYSHTIYTTAWALATRAELQTYRIAAGWNVNGPQWSSESATVGYHYIMNTNGVTSQVIDSTSINYEPIATIIA